MLAKRIKETPAAPGIYRWLGNEGTVLYVGKAKNIRNRLRSYLQKGDKGPWKAALLRQVKDFDVTVTTNELEALVLETNLIKKLRPKYNVLMKDDKNYVYVRVAWQDPYPSVDVVRRMEGNGAKYFGPYLSAWETRKHLDLLNLLFPYQACQKSLDLLNRSSGGSAPGTAVATAVPCLGHQIGKCCGLCVGAITQEEYRSHIEQIMRFFKGDHEPVKERIRILMQEAATAKKFERAAGLRDHLQMVEKLEEKQLVSDPTAGDADFIGIALLSGRAHVIVLLQRDGKVIGETHLSLAGQAENVSDVLEQFLPQFYEQTEDIPDIVFISEEFTERDLLEAYLSLKKEKKVRVIIPERGKKSHLLELAQKNALAKAKQGEAKWEANARNTMEALSMLQQILNLPATPERIECYDISHLGGTETVGSMIVFRDAKPVRDHYRAFALRDIEEGEVDDYKSLKEVLTRRLKYLGISIKEEEKEWNKKGMKFGRARAKEIEVIQKILEENQMGAVDLKSKDFLVGRKEKEILACARLYKHPGTILEIKSVWVHDSLRGNKLGHFLVRKLLKTVKKGKVYVCINPDLHEYYAETGFRHVLTPPALLQEKMNEFHTENPNSPVPMAMVHDTIQNKIDPSFTVAPDLIVIDGGKGQLSSVMEIVQKSDLSIPVIGLAKREEDVFVPGVPAPIAFPKDSPAKFLLMRMRDEAHRFANRLRETRGKKRAVHSALDEISGIGPQTKRELLERFGSVTSIKEASDEELATVLTEGQLRELRANL